MNTPKTNISIICPFIFVVAFPILLAAQTTGLWSVTLLEKPFHVGDQRMQAFAVPEPNGDKYKGEFTLPPTVKNGMTDTFLVVIDVSDLTSRKDKTSVKLLRRGEFLTKLLLNGVEIEILNKLVRGKEGARNIERLTIPIRGDTLKKGQNIIEIIPGADSRNLEDFEIHRLVISSKAL